ncbi:protein cornichon homolog 3 isoform X4 [Physeter macrocephalus]|uniref:Protein cornichon homolog 3 isoform X4 n=1 Tax=Physeter macrocephalus TaxID=9755 RepID=A0A9W2WL64_PHYMC|nr:protein cornichon homolog 3 isoform X4 [Physeter catodon]
MFLPEFRQAQLFVPASEAAWLQVLMCVQIFLEPLPWNCPPQEYEVWGAGSGSRWSQEDGSGSRQFQTSPRAPSCPLQAVFTPPTPVLSLGSDLRSPSLSSRPPPALAGLGPRWQSRKILSTPPLMDTVKLQLHIEQLSLRMT